MPYITRIVCILVALTLLGVVGFRFTEGWELLDCLYMTVISLTTVGYGEIEPLSDGGKIFAIVYLGTGLGVFLFCLAELGQMVVAGVFREWVEKRHMEKVKDSLKGHFIVCGFGRMGQIICRHLASSGLPFIVIDKDESALAECRERQWLCVLGDTTEDRVLTGAGIEKARGLVATVASEADNLYIVLSARLLAKSVFIVAKALSDEGAAKLKRAGADRVVNIYGNSASKMAQWLVNPNVQEFIELVTASGPEIDLTEIQVKEESPYAGVTLAETDLRKRGVMVVAIRHQNELMTAPAASTVIRPNDSLVALGSNEAILALIQAMQVQTS